MTAITLVTVTFVALVLVAANETERHTEREQSREAESMEDVEHGKACLQQRKASRCRAWNNA